MKLETITVVLVTCLAAFLGITCLVEAAMIGHLTVFFGLFLGIGFPLFVIIANIFQCPPKMAIPLIVLFFAGSVTVSSFIFFPQQYKELPNKNGFWVLGQQTTVSGIRISPPFLTKKQFIRTVYQHHWFFQAPTAEDDGAEIECRILATVVIPKGRYQEAVSMAEGNKVLVNEVMSEKVETALIKAFEETTANFTLVQLEQGQLQFQHQLTKNIEKKLTGTLLALEKPVQIVSINAL